jgi:hypothetical protein
MIDSSSIARPSAHSVYGSSMMTLWMGFGACCALAASGTRASAQLDRREPTPEPAIAATIALFQTYDVVATSAAHGAKDLDDFILTLVRTPGFHDAVNDIVVECGNSRYQSILDRYIAGENVPLTEVQKVWRETVGPHMCAVSSFYNQLFPLVRRINQGLASAKRLRVVAGDPPIDWSTVTTQAAYTQFVTARDSNIAAVMEREVLAKRRKALMLFGAAHIAHGLTATAASAARAMPNGFAVASAVGRYEERYPGLTFVLDLYDCSAAAKWGAAPDSWRVPSLLRTRGTRLATGSNALLPGPDGILYLGPPELLLYELRPAFPFFDDSLMVELRRRAALMPPNPIRDAYIDVHAGEAETNPFLCPGR